MRDVYFSKHFRIVKEEKALKAELEKRALTLIFNGNHDHPNFHGLIDWSLSKSKLEVAVLVYSSRTDPDSELDLKWNHAALYRREDRSLVAFTRKEYDSRHIEEWIYINSRPPVARLDQVGLQRLIQDGNPALVLFALNPEQEMQIRKTAGMDLISEKHLENLLFMVCNIKDEPECATLMLLCQLQPSDLPILEIVHIPDHQDAPDFVLQYQMVTSTNTSALEELVQGFLVGKAEPWVMSEDHEADAYMSQDRPITKLVGTTISEALKFSNRRNRDLLVLFHEGAEDKDSQKALSVFDRAVAHLPTAEFMAATYNHKKNTRVGLSLSPSSGRLLRLYRRGDRTHFVERPLEVATTVEEVLEFVIDAATPDLTLTLLEQEHV